MIIIGVLYENYSKVIGVISSKGSPWFLMALSLQLCYIWIKLPCTNGRKIWYHGLRDHVLAKMAHS